MNVTLERWLASRRCISVTLIAAAVAATAPLNAFAIACGGAAGGAVLTASPRFVGQNVQLQMEIGAQTLDSEGQVADEYLDIFSAVYYSDCTGSQQWALCTNNPDNDIEFISYDGTTCVGPSGPVAWNFPPEDDFAITFTAPIGNPARFDQDAGDSEFPETCTIDFTVKVNSIAADPNYPYLIFGAPGFNDAECNFPIGDELTANGGGSLAFTLQSCALDLTKEVSNDGGTSWFDANVSPGPDIELPGDALYRLIVSNTGTANFVAPITINDGALNISGATVPALNAGASAIVTSGDIPALFAEDRCTQAGALENTSNADAVCTIDESISASDFDNAWVNCVPPPSINVKKYVSVDGGTTYFDANEVDKSDWPPLVEFPNDAYYKIVVSNDGAVDLVDVVVNDTELGIVNYSVGSLAAGAFVELDSGDIDALFVDPRCDAAGIYDNTATADGNSALTGTPADQASDPANMECVPPPEISIQKEIRVPGDDTWYDADTVGLAPSVTFPSDAEYRFIVCNVGGVDLANVTVEDTTLGITPAVNIGSLPAPPDAGACVTIDQGTVGFGDLYVVDRCTVAGEFDNTAAANGESALIPSSTVGPVTDPAWLVCRAPGNEICRTIGFWGARAGYEKAPKSQNVTQRVICSVQCGADDTCLDACEADPDSYPGIKVCGTTITNTAEGNYASALEAICATPKGDPRVQMLRQLTGATLNCLLGDCDTYHTELVAECNDVCEANDDVGAIQSCTAQLDCFNNGGEWDDIGGFCYFPGTCSLTPQTSCVNTEDEDDVTAACVTVLGSDTANVCVEDETCHDREACPDLYDNDDIDGSDLCFEPLGPASSPKTCNAARKNEILLP